MGFSQLDANLRCNFAMNHSNRVVIVSVISAEDMEESNIAIDAHLILDE